MLELLHGPDRTANSMELLEQICRNAKSGVSGQILIVPEQYSHETERALCMHGGETISRYAEVLSFTRLATRVFSVYGGVCEEYLDENGRILTLYLAAQQVREQLKFYAAVMTRPDFLMHCTQPPRGSKGGWRRKSQSWRFYMKATCPSARQDAAILSRGRCACVNFWTRRSFWMDARSFSTASQILPPCRFRSSEQSLRTPKTCISRCSPPEASRPPARPGMKQKSSFGSWPPVRAWNLSAGAPRRARIVRRTCSCG